MSRSVSPLDVHGLPSRCDASQGSGRAHLIIARGKGGGWCWGRGPEGERRGKVSRSVSPLDVHGLPSRCDASQGSGRAHLIIARGKSGAGRGQFGGSLEGLGAW